MHDYHDHSLLLASMRYSLNAMQHSRYGAYLAASALTWTLETSL